MTFLKHQVLHWLVARAVSKNIKQLGYSQEKFLSGKVSWPRITHPDDVPILEKEVENILAKRTDSWSQTYRVCRRDGMYRWIRDWNLLLRDEQGVPRKIQGIIFDITKEHDEAQEHEKTRAALEKALESVIAGFIPICAQCKAIRDEAGNWIRVEAFINQHNPVQFTHGYCPECCKKLHDKIDNS
jgi:PAS domain S-box-containing protein